MAESNNIWDSKELRALLEILEELRQIKGLLNKISKSKSLTP